MRELSSNPFFFLFLFFSFSLFWKRRTTAKPSTEPGTRLVAEPGFLLIEVGIRYEPYISFLTFEMKRNEGMGHQSVLETTMLRNFNSFFGMDFRWREIMLEINIGKKQIGNWDVWIFI